MNRLSLSLILSGCALFVVACAVAVVNPTSDTITAQIARGQPLYAQTCATAKCHGAQGQGLGADSSFQVWPLVGAKFQGRNPTAQVVFDVVRSGSEQNLRALTDQQIYDAIAYELSQNGAPLAAPLTGENAATIATGPSTFKPAPGRLFPPLGNASSERSFTGGTGTAQGYLSWRVDQIVQTSAIAGQAPSNGGTFLILVLAFATQTSQPLTVGPEFLQLSDSQGNILDPQEVDLAYPIERFQAEVIQFDHGTAAVVVFELPAGATLDHLTYDDHTGHPLLLKLRP